jgi:hypothetical protein
MCSENNKLKLPPGHEDGFNASEELIEKVAIIILESYILPQNCKGKNIGFCLPIEDGQPKKWIFGKLKSFSHKCLVKAIKEGHLCYGSAHADFSNLFVIDVDDPDSGDEQVIREALEEQGWSFKCFHSGRGRHFWVFFDALPRKLLGAYDSGVGAMKAVGGTFLDLYADELTDKIDLRGCGNQLIKLPLQYDPYHKWVIMPFTDDGVLIEDYELAVEYTEMISRNDSSGLLEWLQRSQMKIQKQDLKSCFDNLPQRNKASDSIKPGDSFEEYLNSVRVGPGESNNFMYEFVKLCWREGMSEKQIPVVVENLYTMGKNQGRITCKDTLQQWLSKAKSQAKKYYVIVGDYSGIKDVKFYQSDLEWISSNAESERDRLFLAIHLWAFRMNEGAEYFLSRPKAVEFGISDIQYRSAKKKYEKRGLLIEVKKGKRGSSLPGIRGIATKYRFSIEPVSSGEVLEIIDPRELIKVLEEKELLEKENCVRN